MKKQILRLVYLLVIGFSFVLTSSCEKSSNDNEDSEAPEMYTTAWYLMQNSWASSSILVKADCSNEDYAMPWTEIDFDYEATIKFFSKGVVKFWMNGEFYEASQKDTWYLDESKNPKTLNYRISGLPSSLTDGYSGEVLSWDIETLDDEQLLLSRSETVQFQGATILYSYKATYQNQ